MRLWFASNAIAGIMAAICLAPAVVTDKSQPHFLEADGAAQTTESRVVASAVAEHGVEVMRAGSFVQSPKGTFAFWHQESRQSPDDSIKVARLGNGRWGKPVAVTNARATGNELGRSIETVSDPVGSVGAGGRLHVFYTAVSLRAWSTSFIVSKYSDDEGGSWSRAKRLVTSPLLNISMRTRARPLASSDEYIRLPAYWRIGTKYPLLITLDGDGEVRAVDPSVRARDPEDGK